MAVTRPAPVWLDDSVEEIISEGAHSAGLTEQEFVAAASEAYWALWREQQWLHVREALSKLDGTRRARVALRTGLSPERLDQLGGVGA